MNHVKDVMVEPDPKDGVWWTYPEDERTNQVSGWEMLAKRVSSDQH
jgi:hypothetical protein